MKQFNQLDPPLLVPAFTRDGTFQNVALPVGVDPAAKLVTIEVECIFSAIEGVAPFGTAFPDSEFQWNMTSGNLATVTVPVVSGQVKLSCATIWSSFRVVAEWGGDNVVTTGDLVRSTGWNLGNTGTYRDVGLTSYFGADAGNVEAVLCYYNQSFQATPDTGFDGADARPEGSTYNGADPPTFTGRTSACVKIVNPTDIVEVRESGISKGGDPVQNSCVSFVGYIVKGSEDDGTGSFFRYHGVDDPLTENIGIDAWKTYDAEPLTSASVFSIYCRTWRWGAGSHNHYVRKIGSGTGPRAQGQHLTYVEFPVEVDGNKEVEQWLETGVTPLARFWLWGWLDFDGRVPGQATNPDPTDTETGVSIRKILSWSAGVDALSHDVYFGTDPTPGAGEFQGNQPGTSFEPGPLQTDTTYFWRIDEVNGSFTTTGVVWSFTTRSPVCIAAEPSAFQRVSALTSTKNVVAAVTSAFKRISAITSTPQRVGATPSAFRRISARIFICGEVGNMKANALCPDELAWNSDNVLNLDEVVDDMADPATPITSATSVACAIFDSDTGTELSLVSPVTLTQVGSTNHWRNTVTVNAANGFTRKQRLRLVYTFDGGVDQLGEFEALAVVAAAVN